MLQPTDPHGQDKMGLLFKKKFIGKSCGSIWVIYYHLRLTTMTRCASNYNYPSWVLWLPPQVSYRVGILVCLGCYGKNNNKNKDWVEQQAFIFIIAEPGNLRLGYQHDEGPLPSLQTATFSLCPHMILRERSSLSCLLLKGTNCIHEGYTLILHLITLKRPHHIEVKASMYESWWDPSVPQKWHLGWQLRQTRLISMINIPLKVWKKCVLDRQTPVMCYIILERRTRCTNMYLSRIYEYNHNKLQSRIKWGISRIHMLI